jgi:GABA(A) receptor-associated protein
MTGNNFKKENSAEKRKAESERIRDKYPDRVPIVLIKATGTKLPDIDKYKFLVPGDLTITYFQTVIRKRLVLKQEEALYLFCGNTIPTQTNSLNEIYKKNKDEDGFLYLTYSTENTFGCRDPNYYLSL